jgi:hypothetical protein
VPITTAYGVTLTVEAGLSSSVADGGIWDVALWDSPTATWGPDEVWTDISQYVRKISTDRKFSRDLQVWESGSCTLDLLNFDGRFSPSNTTGPYSAGGFTQIRPWRPIRILASYGDTARYVYTGYALAWEEYYEQASPGKGGAYVTVPCSDELAKLSRFDGLEQTPVGAGELTGARIHRILNNAGNTAGRTIDAGVVTVQATNLSQNATTEIKLTADSEGGAFFVDPNGVLVFSNQFSLIETPRSNTSQVTYGDGGGTEVPYSAITLAYNGDLVSNIAAFARTNSTVANAGIVANQASRALYGDRRQVRTDLVCETDAQVHNLAALWVARYADPEQRVVSVTVKPRNTPAVMFPDVLERRIRDLVTIKRRPPDGRTITNFCHIAGIQHQITKDDWQTTFLLWSATPWRQYSTSLWDTGKWDEALWFFG